MNGSMHLGLFLLKLIVSHWSKALCEGFQKLKKQKDGGTYGKRSISKMVESQG